MDWSIWLDLAQNTWGVWLDAAPWLLFGLVVAGLLKAWFPAALINRWLGGRGIGPVFKAALIGTPVPLCSCSVLPAAMTLRRGGASRGATVSFLISTPENGADSLAISYALLGPFMTLVRPVAAICSAVFAGLAAESIDDGTAPPAEEPKGTCCNADNSSPIRKAESRLVAGLRYAVTDLLTDIFWWMVLGVVLAGVIRTFVPTDVMASWGSGIFPMLAMLAIGVPMYICATASTPVAAAMLLAGISPGTVLVFLLAGPATNIGSMGVIRKELGSRTLIVYLMGICAGSVLLGLLTDVVVARWDLNIVAQASEAAHFVPHWLALASGIVLIGLGLRGWINARRTS
ncbi:MAG: SO_0444 family Cu/Zn efflux transporter [Phycisphaerae bacterium]|nr:SO_0444 family Cu/Zn efflux transporter [Phycisphaerae bacterium]